MAVQDPVIPVQESEFGHLLSFDRRITKSETLSTVPVIHLGGSMRRLLRLRLFKPYQNRHR